MKMIRRGVLGDAKEYLALLREKYKTESNLDFFVNDVLSSILSANNSLSIETFSLLEGDALLGHVALIMNPDLPQGEAFFGFFETENDKESFTMLWKALITFARSKGVTVLKGPANGSIWHQYRVIGESGNFPFFKSEPFSEKYYYELLKGASPTSEITYHSGFRKVYDNLILTTEKDHRQALQNSFSIVRMDTIGYNDLEKAFLISKEVFAKGWGYTGISLEDFLLLYSSKKLAENAYSIYFLMHHERIIGYVTVFEEDKKTLVFKTAAVLGEFQGQGLGNALLHRVHIDAKDREYSKIIYALIRDGNRVKNLTQDDALVLRRYSAFEFTL